MQEKKLIEFKYDDDTYVVTATDYPDELFFKEKFVSVYEPTHDIDIYSFDDNRDVELSITKNGKALSDFGEQWAGGKVTDHEFVEHIMTMYINGMDKSRLTVTNVCDEIQRIKTYYHNALDNGKYFVEFNKAQVYSLDIESINYKGYTYCDDCIMLGKDDMRLVTDYPNFYLECVTGILDDADDDVIYFQYSVDELKRTAIDNDIKCGLSFFNDEELDLTEQERGRG